MIHQRMGTKEKHAFIFNHILSAYKSRGYAIQPSKDSLQPFYWFMKKRIFIYVI